MFDTKSFVSQMQQFSGVEAMKKMMDEQSSRVGQVYEELGKAHARWIEFGNAQLDEMTEMAKAQFNYVNELGAGWRKLTQETAKKAVESMKA